MKPLYSLPRLQGGGAHTKRSGPARIFREHESTGGCAPVPSAYFPSLPTKVLFKPTPFLLLALHEVGGVRLLQVPKGCLAGWV